MSYQKVRRRLNEGGVLLLSDKELPSVVGLIAGPGVVGSWWGHKKGREIWRVLKRLDADPDVLLTRLVSGKVTYVDRRLWPAFMTVATSRESWQTKGLTSTAKRLLSDVTKSGEIRMDRYRAGKDPKRLRAAASELERRLLAYSDEIHTEKGSHAKILATWPRSPKLRGERFQAGDTSAAKMSLEAAIQITGCEAALPWREVL